LKNIPFLIDHTLQGQAAAAAADGNAAVADAAGGREKKN
jgi:hypothetical protein